MAWARGEAAALLGGRRAAREGAGKARHEPIEVLTNRARDYGGAVTDFQEAAEAATFARARAEG